MLQWLLTAAVRRRRHARVAPRARSARARRARTWAARQARWQNLLSESCAWRKYGASMRVSQICNLAWTDARFAKRGRRQAARGSGRRRWRGSCIVESCVQCHGADNGLIYASRKSAMKNKMGSAAATAAAATAAGWEAARVAATAAARRRRVRRAELGEFLRPACADVVAGLPSR